MERVPAYTIIIEYGAGVRVAKAAIGLGKNVKNRREIMEKSQEKAKEQKPEYYDLVRGQL